MNIKPKLTITISFMLVASIGVISYVSFEYVERTWIDSQLSSMNQELNDKAIEIDVLHQRASEDLVFALKNPKFVEYFELPETKAGNAYDDNGVLQFTEKQKEIKQGLEQWIFHFQDKFDVDETCIIDITGQEHARLVLKKIEVDENLSSEEGTATFFEPSFLKQKDEVHVQYPYVSPDTNRWVFAYTSPVVLGSGDKPAIYHFEMPMITFQNILTENQGRMYVVDPSGYVVVDSKITQDEVVSFDPRNQFSSFQQAFGEENLELLEEMKTNKAGNGKYYGKGLEHYFVYKTLPTFDWILVYSIPEYQLIEGDTTLTNLRDTLIITTAVVIMGGIVTAVFISNKLSNPLIKLKDATRELGQGNLDIDTKTDANDEIGQLSNSFHEMAKLVKKTQNEKKEFVSMITHELKTPLQPIQGYSYMLKEEQLGKLNEKQLNAIKQIDSNSYDLLQLIENLLTAQKLDVQKIEFKKEDISLEELGESIHQSLLPLMSEKNIRFVNSVKTDIHVTGDSKKLKEIFINLVQNSVDFVPNEKGLIEIGFYDKVKKHAILYVKDNGSGISKESQKRLFDKFYQVDSSVYRKYGGTGLGLAICKGFIEGMGGKIWVNSTKGVGSTFFFSIPIVKK